MTQMSASRRNVTQKGHLWYIKHYKQSGNTGVSIYERHCRAAFRADAGRPREIVDKAGIKVSGGAAASRFRVKVGASHLFRVYTRVSRAAFRRAVRHGLRVGAF